MSSSLLFFLPLSAQLSTKATCDNGLNDSYQSCCETLHHSPARPAWPWPDRTPFPLLLVGETWRKKRRITSLNGGSSQLKVLMKSSLPSVITFTMWRSSLVGISLTAQISLQREVRQVTKKVSYS